MRSDHSSQKYPSGSPAGRLGMILALLCSAAILTAAPQQTTVTETYQVAYDFGFRDGRTAGESDRVNGGLYDVANKREFQAAENGYTEGVHDREVYIVAYRRGFEDGYDEGFGLTEPSGAGPAVTNEPIPGVPGERNPDVVPVPVRSDVPLPLRTRGGIRLPEGTHVLVELRNTLNSRYSERGDSFRARTVEDVVLNQEVVVPRGTVITGEVSHVKRAGRVRGRAQLNLRFDRLKLPDGREAGFEAKVVGIERRSAEKVKNKGEEGTIVAPGSKGEDAKSIGKASGLGALVGVLTGGKKGAAAGAAAGAVAGLAGVLMTRGQDAVLEAGTELTIEFTSEATIPD